MKRVFLDTNILIDYITPCLVPCEVLFYKKKAENDTLTL